MSQRITSVNEFLAAANRGIIGISPTEPHEIFGGYDQAVWIHGNEWYQASAEVRVQLADYMIALWQQRRAEWGVGVLEEPTPQEPK